MASRARSGRGRHLIRFRTRRGKKVSFYTRGAGRVGKRRRATTWQHLLGRAGRYCWRTKHKRPGTKAAGACVRHYLRQHRPRSRRR
jgi:hypothetical protein